MSLLVEGLEFDSCGTIINPRKPYFQTEPISTLHVMKSVGALLVCGVCQDSNQNYMQTSHCGT